MGGSDKGGVYTKRKRIDWINGVCLTWGSSASTARLWTVST